MKTIEFYEVSDSFDSEGRGPKTVIGRFSTKNVADRYAVGRGNYGNKADVIRHSYTVCETIEEQLAYDIESAKKYALSKLTQEEKKLLGLI